MSEAEPSRLGPALGTAVFVLVVPGTVIVWIPYEICGWKMEEAFFGVTTLRGAGAAAFLLALPVFVDFLVRFVKEGLGTPAPIAEPRRLVTGVFRYCRNPGYVAVVSMIAGQALFFGSAPTLLYAGGVALAFHLFVLLYEEPHLLRKFRAEYEAYCARVPRWLPRLRSS